MTTLRALPRPSAPPVPGTATRSWGAVAAVLTPVDGPVQRLADATVWLVFRLSGVRS